MSASSPLPGWNTLHEPTPSSVGDTDEQDEADRARPRPNPGQGVAPNQSARGSGSGPISGAGTSQAASGSRLQPKPNNMTSAAKTRPRRDQRPERRMSSDEEPEQPRPKRGRRPKTRAEAESASAPASRRRAADPDEKKGTNVNKDTGTTYRDLFGTNALRDLRAPKSSGSATQPRPSATQPAPASASTSQAASLFDNGSSFSRTMAALSGGQGGATATQSVPEHTPTSSLTQCRDSINRQTRAYSPSHPVASSSSTGPGERQVPASARPAKTSGSELKIADSSRKQARPAPPAPARVLPPDAEVIDLLSDDDDAPPPPRVQPKSGAAHPSSSRTALPSSSRNALPSSSRMPPPATQPAPPTSRPSSSMAQRGAPASSQAGPWSLQAGPSSSHAAASSSRRESMSNKASMTQPPPGRFKLPDGGRKSPLGRRKSSLGGRKSSPPSHRKSPPAARRKPSLSQHKTGHTTIDFDDNGKPREVAKERKPPAAGQEVIVIDDDDDDEQEVAGGSASVGLVPGSSDRPIASSSAWPSGTDKKPKQEHIEPNKGATSKGTSGSSLNTKVKSKNSNATNKGKGKVIHSVSDSDSDGIEIIDPPSQANPLPRTTKLSSDMKISAQEATQPLPAAQVPPSREQTSLSGTQDPPSCASGSKLAASGSLLGSMSSPSVAQRRDSFRADRDDDDGPAMPVDDPMTTHDDEPTSPHGDEPMSEPPGHSETGPDAPTHDEDEPMLNENEKKPNEDEPMPSDDEPVPNDDHPVLEADEHEIDPTPVEPDAEMASPMASPKETARTLAEETTPAGPLLSPRAGAGLPSMKASSFSFGKGKSAAPVQVEAPVIQDTAMSREPSTAPSTDRTAHPQVMPLHPAKAITPSTKTLSAVTPCGANNAMSARVNVGDPVAPYGAGYSAGGSTSSADAADPSTSMAGPSTGTTEAFTSVAGPSGGSPARRTTNAHSTAFEPYDETDLFAGSEDEEIGSCRMKEDKGKGKARADADICVKENTGKGKSKAEDTDELTSETAALQISAKHPGPKSAEPYRAEKSTPANLFTSVVPPSSSTAPGPSHPAPTGGSPFVSTTWGNPRGKRPPPPLPKRRRSPPHDPPRPAPSVPSEQSKPLHIDFRMHKKRLSRSPKDVLKASDIWRNPSPGSAPTEAFLSPQLDQQSPTPVPDTPEEDDIPDEHVISNEDGMLYDAAVPHDDAGPPDDDDDDMPQQDAIPVGAAEVNHEQIMQDNIAEAATAHSIPSPLIEPRTPNLVSEVKTIESVSASEDSDEEMLPAGPVGRKRKRSSTSPSGRSDVDETAEGSPVGRAESMVPEESGSEPDSSRMTDASAEQSTSEGPSEDEMAFQAPRVRPFAIVKHVARKTTGRTQPAASNPHSHWSPTKASDVVAAEGSTNTAGIKPISHVKRPLPTKRRSLALQNPGLRGREPLSTQDPRLTPSRSMATQKNSPDTRSLRQALPGMIKDRSPTPLTDVTSARETPTSSPAPPPRKRRRVQVEPDETDGGPSNPILISSEDEDDPMGGTTAPKSRNSDDEDAASVAGLLTSSSSTGAAGGAVSGLSDTVGKAAGAVSAAVASATNMVSNAVRAAVNLPRAPSSEAESVEAAAPSEVYSQSEDERAARARRNPDPYRSASSDGEFMAESSNASDASAGVPSQATGRPRRRRKRVNYKEIPPSDGEAESHHGRSVSPRAVLPIAAAARPLPLPCRRPPLRSESFWAAMDRIRHTPPPYFKAKDIPHILEDTVNAMTVRSRNQDGIRFMMEESIKDADREERGVGLDGPMPPPIRITNEVDGDITPPWEFHYSNVMWHGKHVAPPNRKDRVACRCAGQCGTYGDCACLKLQREWTRSWGTKDFAYDANKRLKEFNHPVFECNELCGCDDTCRNRVIQQGRRMPLTLSKTPAKGWGVFNGNKRIKAGEFIGIYAGELLGQREAYKRGKKYNRFGRTYLFDLDFWYLQREDKNQPARPRNGGQDPDNPDVSDQPKAKKSKKKGRPRKRPPSVDEGPSSADQRMSSAEAQTSAQGAAANGKPVKPWTPVYTVDAYQAGNFTRFFNHCCDPNLQAVAAYVNEANLDKPLLTFFAARDIPPHQELTFSYSGPDDDGEDGMPEVSQVDGETIDSDEVYAKCLCGAQHCTGKMFKTS